MRGRFGILRGIRGKTCGTCEDEKIGVNAEAAAREGGDKAAGGENPS